MTGAEPPTPWDAIDPLPRALTQREQDQPHRTPPFDDLAGLYDTYAGPVYRLALRLCRNSSEAEDLCHDVFLRFWRQDRYEPSRGPLLAYLLLLTRSMAINRINQRKNRWQLVQRWSEQLFPAGVPDPQARVEADDLAERVRTALEAIPANQRQVLEMAYYEGLSQSAISEKLQQPLGTIKTRSRQGLIRLRELLIDFRNQP
ncbi:sigma-70 family RNA polymerase sigma factor [Synechococcus sp. Tobar12-5m-g]|uniref:sigma-70 family RNA polymerase sigma factor n=1 Tax=unclassified Synechococcus TaxID=2626047 RepID=UPI0020CD8FD8|nr:MULTISPECIES: sigma-70 family RNA polymerase sigma factor [unclassified Synechococcus]MCP9772045.1 sigma-70 family RNA polymerase sigma factor [Synechococcus sp. Tobar12-5m-g]MCP9872987.1 sigma-70 family RNA polymerase sigma factor [Synechococcus sp. Cruz CV-v-12]